MAFQSLRVGYGLVRSTKGGEGGGEGGGERRREVKRSGGNSEWERGE